VDKIIFTGGKGEDSTHSESEVAKVYAIKKKVKPEDILIETKSNITEENLKYAKEIATGNNLKSFTIVSDPLHMKRAISMAKVLIWRSTLRLHQVLLISLCKLHYRFSLENYSTI
jgi:uncharacterized SAM-binding protein YcdF (DUF218 family)